MKRSQYLLLVLFLITFSLTAYTQDNPVDISSYEEAEKAIAIISNKIATSPTQSKLYVSRGDLYYLIHDFDNSRIGLH